MNEHIKGYLFKYLELKKPDFAVMITGVWGCGKTHFIKEFIKEYRKSFPPQKFLNCLLHKKQKKIVPVIKYVSLHGITDKDSIVANLIITNGKLKNGLAIFSSIAKCFSFANGVVNFSPQNICSSEYFKGLLKNNILIFDDFERCDIDKVTLLGYLSEFVENQNLHVIILGDETKIKAPQKYRLRKEKVVGKSFELESDDNKVLPLLINAMEENLGCLYPLVHRHTAELSSILNRIAQFCNNKKTNYRIVKYLLNEFQISFAKLFENNFWKDKEDDVFLQLFNRFSIAYYALQSCIISGTDALGIQAYTEHDENVKKFRRTFPEWSMDVFIPFEFWELILNNKTVSCDELKDHISHRLFTQKENWEKLWYFFTKSDEELEKLVNEVRYDLEQQRYLSPIAILHTFATLQEMSRDKFIDQTLDEIKLTAQKYIENIGDKIEYIDPGDNGRNLLRFNGSGLRVYSEGSNETKELVQLLIAALDRKKKMIVQKKYTHLIENLFNNMNDFKSWAYSGEHYEDIFSNQDPSLFWNAWIKLPTEKFIEIGHCFDHTIINDQLLNHRASQNEFWQYLLEQAKQFIGENQPHKKEKSKCLYLEKFFINNVKNSLRIENL